MKGERNMRLQIRSDRMEEVEGMRSEYPYAYHHVDLRRTPVPWHWHEALEFGLVREGTLQVSTAGQTRTFQAGEGFFINRNVLTAMACDGPCVLDSHLFHPVLLGGHFHSVYQIKYLNPVIQNRGLDLLPIDGQSRTGRELLQRLRQLSLLQTGGNAEFQTRNLLSEIWLQLLQCLQETPVRTEPGRNQERMLTMMAFIHEHYAEPLTLASLGETFQLSRQYIMRLFQKHLHTTVTHYITQLKMRHALELLRHSNFRINEVSDMLGYRNTYYFCRVFHQHFGMTPTEYIRHGLDHEA